MRASIPLLTAGLGLLAAAPLAAQAWDTPSFLPPSAGDRIGVYLTGPEGGDFGIVASIRQSGVLNLGLRGGFAQPSVGSTRFLVGSDIWSGLASQGADSPFDVAWTAGIGAAFGDGTRVRAPVGLSIGRRIALAGLELTPYVHPRVALQILAGHGDSDSGFGLTADLGADLRIRETLTLRVGAALGKDEAIGAGVAWRTGRPVSAR